MKKYKDEVPLEKRIKDSIDILRKYPGYVPVIIDYSKELDDKIKKRKYLIPRGVCISYFIFKIREKLLNIDSSTSLFIFCDNILLNPTQIIDNIYEEYMLKKNRKDDLYMYLHLSIENTFG